MQVRPLFVLLAPMLLFLSGLFSPAFCVQHQMLSEGGPYLSTGSREIEKFTAKIVVPSKFLNQPVWITFYNGYKTRPGYNWVRVFLSRDGENPQSGNILVDEHTFLNTHAKSVDLTGQLQESGNVLFIEGVGRKGAEFCWVLSSVPSNLSIVNVSKVVPGKQFLIHGTGFSGNANENIVMLGNKRLTVHGVENGILTVEAPADLDDKNSQLSVEVNGTRSNPMAVSMGVMPPHLASLSPYGGPVGVLLTVYGTGFSRVPDENIVKLGSFTAPVIRVLENGLVCRVPDWSGYTTLPVTVITNGVRSENQLSFWCTSHLYGGNPSSAGYQND